MTLFREQVSEYRKIRLHGEVVLTQPLSTRLMVGALCVVVAIAALWVVFGTYSRIETAPGILMTDQPSAKIFVPIPGLVTELRIQDGATVRKGDRIAVIGLDRRAESSIAVAREGIDMIDSRRIIGQSQIALSDQQRDAEVERIKGVTAAATNQITYLRNQIMLQREVFASSIRLKR